MTKKFSTLEFILKGGKTNPLMLANARSELRALNAVAKAAEGYLSSGDTMEIHETLAALAKLRTPIVEQPVAKLFKVACVSKNQNSFGLTGIVLVAADGEAFEAASYTLGEGFAVNRGDCFTLRVSNPHASGTDCYSWVSTSGRTFEIPRAMTKAPADVIAELFPA